MNELSWTTNNKLWKVEPLKKIFSFEKGKNAALYTKEYLYDNPGEYPVYSGQTENNGVMGLIDSFDYNLNECLFTTTVGAKVMTVAHLKGKFSLSQNCLIMIPKNNDFNIRFYYYQLMCLFNYEKALIPSHMQPSLRMEDLKKYKILSPNILMQDKIVAYLDNKINNIDSLIENQTNLIKLLNQQRQSIITEAVTKGLNPNVKMKDSGVEWIGERQMLIFPRFHQLDAVRKLEADVNEKQVGQNYLIQHSAGSGKTNSISWLAHRLAKLHNENNEPIFSSVIVITDRRVLDKQLQDAVYQLEHKAGMVAPIDKDSEQLARALNNETRIIITTLQKFPFVLEKVAGLERKKYAVIIDEAHSSQGGKASTALTNVLSDKTLEAAYEEDRIAEENLDDVDEKIVETIMKSGKQDNVSFFAFTATPKPKTLEKFGTMGTDGKPHAFHQYTMRQAIEEGFILDVLENYTTYQTFWKIAKTVDDDPEVSKKQATRTLSKYVSLHPHSIAQKTEIIMEHYRNFVQRKIGGRAKAMVVTASRLHAVRYKMAFDKYINDMGYDDLKTVVAFSGTVKDNEINYTEPDMNGFSEKELPEKFNSDEYKVLLVAEKYQTGFDEPLLHTMYVDKPLSGIKAVQTLSRLNRTCPGKEDTFVLDFINDPAVIKESFQPYYESTSLSEVTDPNILYDMQAEIEPYQVFTEDEVQQVNEIEVAGGVTKSTRAQTALNAILDQGVERFKDLSDEEQFAFKQVATKFTRTYGFVLQVVTFIDLDLHKQYIYLTYLLRKLPRGKGDKDVYIADDVALEYYRNQKVFEGSIELEKTGGIDLDPQKHGGGGQQEDEKVRLSSILDKLNDRFGTNFTETDFLSREQVKEDMLNSEEVRQQAKNNTKDNFKFAFERSFMNFVIDRMNTNQEFFMKILENDEFKTYIMSDMMDEVYGEVNN